MRVDEGQCLISLYDVYRGLKPNLVSLADKLVGNNLRSSKDKAGNQKFAEFLQADRKFIFPGQGLSTPAIQSRSELYNFIDILATGFKGPAAVQQFSTDKQAFLSKHAQLLDRLWPPVENPPASPTSSVLPNKRDDKDYCCPSDNAIQNVEACFEPALQFTPTTQRGVYTVQVPIGDIPTFVTVLGVHTHSFWVNKSATREKEHSAKGQPQEPEDETSHAQHKRVRYKCFRRNHCRRPSAKETSENAQGGETKKQSREFRTTIKCDCPAYINGAYKSGDQAVLLACDLRHYRHETGTPQDLRLLPLLPGVHAKLDSICQVTREKVVAKRMLQPWVFSEFLTREYPMLKQEMIHVLDGRFYPKDSDIKNSIAKANKSLRFSAIDQVSTLQVFTSQPKLTWGLLPATGTHVTYTCSPADGLRVSSVDTQWNIHTSDILCDASSPTLSAMAMCLYKHHDEGDEQMKAPSCTRTGIKKVTAGNLGPQILHCYCFLVINI